MNTNAVFQIINNNELVFSDYIRVNGSPSEDGLCSFIIMLKEMDKRLLKTVLDPSRLNKAWIRNGRIDFSNLTKNMKGSSKNSKARRKELRAKGLGNEFVFDFEEAHVVPVDLCTIYQFIKGELSKQVSKKLFSEFFLYDPSENLIDWAVVVSFDDSKMYIGKTYLHSKSPFDETLNKIRQEKWFWLSKLPGRPTLKKIEEDAYGDNESL